MHHSMTLFAIMGIGPGEMLLLGAVAVLLFGKRFPEVMKSVGKSVNEFKRGMAGVEDEIRSVSNIANPNTYLNSPPRPSRPRTVNKDLVDEPTAPRFEPPTSEPHA